LWWRLAAWGDTKDSFPFLISLAIDDGHGSLDYDEIASNIRLNHVFYPGEYTWNHILFEIL
jgi:hypothetical protein